MKYLYTFYLYLIFTSACLAQKIECHVSLGSNISFSSFNDNIYSYAPIPPDIGFYSYRQLPPNVYRKTIPKLGLQVQGDVFYKLQPKVYIGTGLKLLLYRHAYDQEFEENPFDPFGNKWSSEPGYSPPTIIAILSDKIIHTRNMYLSLPIQLHYQINRKMYTYTGINISTPLSVTQKYKSFSYTTKQTGTYQNNSGFVYPNYTSSISEVVSTDKSRSAFNRVIYGLQLGIGFNTSTYSSIKIDFNQGISNTYSDIRENNGIKSFIRTLNFSYDCLLEL